MGSPVAAKGQSCHHCGGELHRGSALDLWVCRYCETGHLHDPGSAEALLPARRLARTQMLRLLGGRLRDRGLSGHGVEGIERVWLPFWQIEGTLAGWQSYVLAPPAGSESPELPVSERSERTVEEVVTRSVSASIPACDSRGYGLLGIAHRVERLPLRPFRPSLLERETVLAVTVSRRTAERRIRLRHQTTVRPAGAREIQQHFRLMRPHRCLIYLPVWVVSLTVHGVPADAVVDGVDGSLLRTRLPGHDEGHALHWWAAGTASAWLGAAHPVIGGLAYGAWTLRRMSSGSPGRGWRGLARWLSGELAGAGPRLQTFDRGEEN